MQQPLLTWTVDDASGDGWAPLTRASCFFLFNESSVHGEKGVALLPLLDGNRSDEGKPEHTAFLFIINHVSSGRGTKRENETIRSWIKDGRWKDGGSLNHQLLVLGAIFERFIGGKHDTRQTIALIN